MTEHIAPHAAMLSGRYAHWHVDPPADREHESWFIVYLDVMTLLLVMLVVLLAFAEGDGDALVSESQPAAQRLLKGGAGPLDGLRGSAAVPGEAAGAVPEPPSEATGVVPEPTVPAQPEEAVVAEPGEAAVAEIDDDPLAGLPISELGDDIEVLVEPGSISFRISNEILFPSGQADLTVSGFAVLDRLMGVLNAVDYRIAVEGHTDNIRIQTERFPSNWELSTGRATRVLRYLEGSGVASARLRATGYADTRAIADNDTAEGRATNRRVELIMETRPPR